MRILIVEDEIRIARFIERGLRAEGYVVDIAPNGQETFDLVDTHSYDLVVLDVVLPDMNGVDICKHLREGNSEIPILMLTGRSAVKDKVRGLNAGADDYLTKPFSFEEFIARIRALIRKQYRQRETIIKIHDLELDQRAHSVKRGDHTIDLGLKEFGLLEYLMLNANRAISRHTLTEHVWHTQDEQDTNALDVAIHRLRSKVDKSFDVKLIHSVRGVGYMIKGEKQLC